MSREYMQAIFNRTWVLENNAARYGMSIQEHPHLLICASPEMRTLTN